MNPCVRSSGTIHFHRLSCHLREQCFQLALYRIIRISLGLPSTIACPIILQNCLIIHLTALSSGILPYQWLSAGIPCSSSQSHRCSDRYRSHRSVLYIPANGNLFLTISQHAHIIQTIKRIDQRTIAGTAGIHRFHIFCQFLHSSGHTDLSILPCSLHSAR